MPSASLWALTPFRNSRLLPTTHSAEYGRTSGGVINAVTRSGTNQFHGDVYEFLRNNAFDARNFFDGPQIPEFRRNQFGAAGGAPIRKDKTFVFADYEGMRQIWAFLLWPLFPLPPFALGTHATVRPTPRPLAQGQEAA